jgi:hypothetical protein
MTPGYIKNTPDLPTAAETRDYAPKSYSVREHAVMGARVFLVIGAVLGLLWLLSAAAAN